MPLPENCNWSRKIIPLLLELHNLRGAWLLRRRKIVPYVLPLLSWNSGRADSGDIRSLAFLNARSTSSTPLLKRYRRRVCRDRLSRAHGRGLPFLFRILRTSPCALRVLARWECLVDR